MKSDKTIFQKIHNFWYVKSDTPDKNNCLDSKGEFNQKYYNEIAESYKKDALEQQGRNRLAFFMSIGLFLVGIFTVIYFVPILICIGLFFGLVGKLLS